MTETILENNFCRSCGASLLNATNFCSKCGIGVIHAANPTSELNGLQQGSNQSLLKKLSQYEKISGILWIVLGAIQVATVIGVIAGVWNIYAGYTKIKISPKILASREKILENRHLFSRKSHSGNSPSTAMDQDINSPTST